MPNCPKCGTNHDDLFSVSECISNHKNEARAAIIAPPRVIEETRTPPQTSASWVELPTGMFSGNSYDMKVLSEYFALFAREFDSWLIFPDGWGKRIPLVIGQPRRTDPATVLYDPELGHRIPITLMSNKKKKRNHGFFRYKMRRHNLSRLSHENIDSLGGERLANLVMNDGIIWRGYNCEIKVAPNLPIQSVICTLAHEMCHYAQYIEADRWIDKESLGGGWGKSHGDTFVRHLKMFNEVARAKGSALRIDKKCHSGRGHDAEVYDRIEWVRDNLKKGDIFYWEWEHTDKNRDPYVGVYSVKGRYAHRVKGIPIAGTETHDQCIPWSCIKYVWRDDFPEEYEPDNDSFLALNDAIEILPDGPYAPQYSRWTT